MSHSNHEFGVGLFSETLYADVACIVIDEVCRIDALHGYVAANHLEYPGGRASIAHDGQADGGSLLAFEVAHDFVLVAPYEIEGVGLDDAVAGLYAGTLGGTALDGVDDIDRVAQHVEGNADARETTLQFLIGLAGIVCGNVG